MTQIQEIEEKIKKSRQRTLMQLHPIPAENLEKAHQERVELFWKLQQLRRNYLKSTSFPPKKRNNLEIEVSITMGEKHYSREFVDRSPREALILLEEFKAIL